MSDRCWYKVTCLAKHAHYFADLGLLAESTDGKCCVLENDEIALDTDELINVAKLGIPFFGEHSSGYDFNCGLFASDGKEFIQVAMIIQGTQPAVDVEDDGSVNQQELDEARKYFMVLADAKKIIETKKGRKR